MKPEICKSELTGKWYVVTARNKDGSTRTKYDVTDQMLVILRQSPSEKEDRDMMRKFEIKKLRENLLIGFVHIKTTIEHRNMLTEKSDRAMERSHL